MGQRTWRIGRAGRVAAIALGALAALASGCGYRFAGRATADPSAGSGADSARIEIRFFENRSSQPGFERLLGDALVEEFARRGEYAPVYAVSSRADDLVLAGVIKRVQVEPSAYSSVGLALENRLRVRLEISLRRAGGALVWAHEGLDLEERYLSSADAGVRESNREQALRKLASELAGRIHDEIAQAR